MVELPQEGPVTAREVAIALNAHIASCAGWQKLHLGFIAATLGVLVIFAGYTYVHEQAIADTLAMTRAQDAQALSQIPARTAQAVSATTSAANSN